GVRDTILVGSAGRVTAVPSSSVRVAGNAGAGVGLGVGAGVVVGVGAAVGTAASGEAVGAGEAAPPAQAARTRTRAANKTPRRVVRADGNGDTGSRPPRLMWGVGGVAPRRETPR